MKFSMITVFLLTAALLSGTPAVTPFRNGERVAFFGDSITQIGLCVNYLHAHQILRHPETRVEFINCGVNGRYRCARTPALRPGPDGGEPDQSLPDVRDE